jgi:hypothetical protein
VEELTARARNAEFDIVEARYACVVNTNKKTGVQLRRVFVHGVFQKPINPQ